jgi:hypothetical protein
VNTAVYQAALAAGCTDRQAEFLAVYVESDKLSDAAAKLGIREQSARVMSARIQRRLNAPHLAAVIARLLHAHLLTH